MKLAVGRLLIWALSEFGMKNNTAVVNYDPDHSNAAHCLSMPEAPFSGLEYGRQTCMLHLLEAFGGAQMK